MLAIYKLVELAQSSVMRSPVGPTLLDQRANPEHVRQQVASHPVVFKLSCSVASIGG